MSMVAEQGAKQSIHNAVISTYVQDQLKVRQVEVEVCVSSGIPTFQIVGLAEKAVKESRERVKAAIMNSGFVFPLRKILVNLSPADLPKTGGYFDLPIALAILLASGQAQRSEKCGQTIWAGELSLLGRVTGQDLFAFAIAAYQSQKPIVLPLETALPAVLQGQHVHQVQSLTDAVTLLQQPVLETPSAVSIAMPQDKQAMPDFSRVAGRQWEKLVMLIAASGGHHLMMQGPPGVGKTLLAQSFTCLLPAMSVAQTLDVAMIYSWMGQARLFSTVPFRMPHHHITPSALLGGGVPFSPGEVSLAHHGVLFLDEITEYKQGLLDQLREALVQGEVHLSRAARKITVDAKFQLIVAMNPCPCGNLGSMHTCICGHLDIKRHQKNLSGPFLDRIDMGMTLSKQENSRPSYAQWLCPQWQEKLGSLTDVQALSNHVRDVRHLQQKRQQCLNRDLSWEECQSFVQTAKQHDADFAALESKLGLHGRGWQKTIRVARTIADCEGRAMMQTRHLRLAVDLAAHRQLSVSQR